MPVYIRNYYYSPAVLYPIDDAHPEECDYDLEVISDLSDKDITNKNIWQIDDNDICSEEEMLEYFNNKYVSDVTDEEEYQKGKEWIIRELHYEEQDFENHPQMIKISIPYSEYKFQYAFKDNFDPIGDGYLPNDWRELDEEELSEIGFDDFNNYDDGDEAYDRWRDDQLTNEN